MSQALRSFGVVPDAINKVPSSVVRVVFRGNIDLHVGQELTTTHVQHAPIIEWEADNSSFYTLCKIDLDVPSRTWPKLREILHWMITNIPGKDVSKGEVLRKYTSAAPLPFTGWHRYVFLVYKQPDRLIFDEKRINTRHGVLNFSVRKFADKYDLGEPIAGNMYQTKFDSNVLQIYRRMICGC